MGSRAERQPDGDEDDEDDRDLPDASDMDDDDEPDIVPCPHCRKAISEDAEQCHHCRQYVTPQESGRSVGIFTAIVIAAVLVAMTVATWVL